LIEAVLFDGDQTLWDFQKVMADALRAVLDELRRARPGPLAEQLGIEDFTADRNEVALELEGVEYNLARLRSLGFARTLSRLRGLGTGSTDEYADQYTDQYTDDEDVGLAERLSALYFRQRDSDPALFDDTVPALDALRHTYRLGLLSNGSRLPETIGLGAYFEAVVFAQDHRVNKPDRALFAVIEREMEVAPEQCVLIGDHPLNDVVGAKRSGWWAVWIDRLGQGRYTPPENCIEVPDAVITSLLELPTVLASW
jgi:HAD superfamily hydrolase (TIGR01509 family)